ncbi:MAG: aldolase/citrate lyase family protein, partial [Campylobacterota bacterium]|nr:aldolase/citrate lyase family protein [Campylobacterota bacterium]
MNRSYLMVAGDKPKHLDKLPVLKCDTAMINLEDGVFDKVGARELLSLRFKDEGLRIKGKEIVVRINPLDEEGVDDIKAMNPLKPDAIRVPKIQTKEDVQKALELVDEDIDIHLSVETKEALH